MMDWVTVADLGTAAGTALLAVATFASTRSASRATATAERALLESLRPILVPSRWDDPAQEIRFLDGRWFLVYGGRAVLETTENVVYLAMSVRNVGRGLAVLHGWDMPAEEHSAHRDPADFHRLTRDVYVPAGDQGFSQVTVRDPTCQEFRTVCDIASAGGDLWLDLLYGDAERTQRVITRFVVSRSPVQDSTEHDWALTANRHWNLDRPDPR
ncbi:hypothetical protein [Catellatospora citrea]|uniref:Uncharacterized protein n=1 Tax=Catellatospora citrea TaxID=53366 RepID=A0A8J3KHD2_9ACTN|nr:hypothetical protein [Catellatospora citrea]RKE12092.1 hypothetical protein C8E86_7028 [Catellatospora citrea]GIF98948.1 hypothetical protein Cci01nite_40420 [Catellatospora citrea]